MSGEKQLTTDTNLREAVHETVSCLLSPHQDVRQAGEIRIKALEVTEDFGVHLAELIVNTDIDVALRQLASIMLKHYVETHWCNYSDKFSPPETVESAKGKIKNFLPYALEDPTSKVRSSGAYAISAIAHWDWPENWPELFDILVRYLRNNENEWGVHGAMRVLSEISHDLTDTQLPHVAPVILSEMYRIFADEEKYGIRVRGRAVEVFTTCAFMISAMSDYHTGAIKHLLNPVLPSFSEKFIIGLKVPDGMNTDSCLKTDIIKAITLLLQQVPKQMVRWLHEILPPIWQILIESAETYLKTVVNDAEQSEQLVDSDGEILGFENLIFSIFEFVHVLVEYPKFSKTVDSALSDLLYYLIVFMQITEEQEHAWRRNPNQFVEDEDDTFSYSVRLSAQDLLVTLCTEYDGGCTALCQAVAKHISQSGGGTFFSTRTSPFWWKTHEACILALGSVHNLLTEKLKSGNMHFDLTGFLQNIVTVDMNMTGYVFLLGRCLWFGSRYANFLPDSMLEQFLQATTTALQPGQMPTIRVCAVRAMWGFCEHLKQSSSVQVLTTFLPLVIENLLSMATEYSCEILALVLEALAIILSIDSSCTAAHSSKVTSLAIAVFLKYNSDPLILTLAQEVFKELSQNSECLIPLQQRLVPTLISILNAAPDKISSGLHSVALDVLQTLVRYSKPPLTELLMNSAFPAAALCILRSDDSSTMQSGGECLRTYVCIAPEQVCNYQDNEGHTGLWYILQVAALLLNPSTAEHSATFVGRLVTTLITKTGNVLGENLDFLLKAVLSKMQRAETLSVFQSLVMIYAHLIHNRLEDVLNFLSSVPGPSGQSALEFVLAKWCSSQHLFYGAYERKVSIVALCKLLQYGVSSNDKRLNEINVKGDEMFLSDAIRTRSQTQCQAPVFTTIPLLVKMYKLLVNELSNQMEANAASDGSEDTDEELEEDSNWEERGEVEQRTSDLNRKDEVDDDDDEDEPDILSDPVYHLNIQQYLADFFQTFSQQPYFPEFLQHLNKEEKKVLSAIGIHV